MNSIKKRKHHAKDQEERNGTDSDEEVQSKRKPSDNKDKMKRKRIVLLSSDEDEDDAKMDGDIEFSINDIKKNAKKRAKNLSKGINSEPDESKSKQSNKTPPVKSHNIMNYFKPLNSAKKSQENITDEKHKENSTKLSFEQKSKIDDDEENGFTYTYIKDKNKNKDAFKNDDDDKIEHKKKLGETKTKDEPSKTKDAKNDESKTKKIPAEKNKDAKKDKSKSELSKKVSSESSLKDVSKKTESSKTKDIKSDESKIKHKIILVEKNKDVKKEEHKSKSESSKKVFSEPVVKDILKKDEAKSESSKKSSESSVKKDILKKEDSKYLSPKKSINGSKEIKSKSPKKPVVEALPRLVEAKRVSELLVDKYKPTSTKQIIGQQGDRSSLNKLLKWLRYWHQNYDKKPGFGKWASDDGAGYKAALLSGPPGIGKTTTAQLACKELGYDFLELNASDARNKKSLQEDVRELLMNTKLTDFFKPKNVDNSAQKLTTKHCVIMDEVDGMAGNEDRGGIQELIQLIKNTRVPMICICNDRGAQKMRSLVNYCFDLRFSKPKAEQMKGYLMSIAYKENIKISPNVLNDLIASSNFDIRQCINNLYMLAAGQTKVGNMINSEHNQKQIKDVKLGPFDAIKKVFSTGEDYARMSFMDKSDLFFCDYSIMPLFVYENYIGVNLSSREPSIAKQLKRLEKTMNSISFGDTIEKEVRTNQNWSLLPLQAAFSTVMPGAYMRSANGLGFPQFPQFMGKLSTTNKNNRLVDELMSHMTLSIAGSRTAFTLDYLEPLRNSLVDPLIKSDVSGVSSVLDIMEYYSLVKEDMDSILDLSLWTGDTDPMKKVDSKTKAALTRAYNKKDFQLPYATDNDARMITKRGKGATKSKKTSKSTDSQSDGDDHDGEEEADTALDFY